MGEVIALYSQNLAAELDAALVWMQFEQSQDCKRNNLYHIAGTSQHHKWKTARHAGVQSYTEYLEIVMLETAENIKTVNF